MRAILKINATTRQATVESKGFTSDDYMNRAASELRGKLDPGTSYLTGQLVRVTPVVYHEKTALADITDAGGWVLESSEDPPSVLTFVVGDFGVFKRALGSKGVIDTLESPTARLERPEKPAVQELPLGKYEQTKISTAMKAAAAELKRRGIKV